MSNVLSKMPNIAIPRTRFKQSFNHATSFDHGKLIPIDCFEVIPGDNVSLKLNSLIRMSTPVAPIFGNIKAFLHAFFVPLRLVWSDAEKFYGDPSNHNKVQSITPVNPTSIEVPNWQPTETDFSMSDFCKSVTSYLGKPFVSDGSVDKSNVFISCLKERGYYVIWNENFRPSNLILPCLVNLSSVSDVSSIGTDYDSKLLDYYHPVLPVCKQYDYFTACTLSPQFGGSVSIPFIADAPVITKAGLHSMGSDGLQLNGVDNASPRSGVLETYNSIVMGINGASSTPVTGMSKIQYSNLYADLSGASSTTINALRYAFQVQKYLERSNYGSRFFEILNAHYGVQSPDGRLQRPDRLRFHEFYINVNQVLATADSGGKQIGSTGAVSVTGDSCHLFSAAFTEPGYLYVMICTKFDRSYSGGVLREDARRTRFEFYSPEFANLGDQEIKRNELALYSDFDNGIVIDDSKGFGYQEHWAEYRYRKDRVSGILNPTSTDQSGVTSMAYWTLSDVFDSLTGDGAVTLGLNDDFLFEDREALARDLVTGVNGPDFIADFDFEYIVTRELPLYSIPGLIDHFGAL